MVFPLQLDLARAGDAEALQAALASLAPRATKDFFGEAARSPQPSLSSSFFLLYIILYICVCVCFLLFPFGYCIGKILD